MSMTSNLTPDQIKSIAAEMRSVEKERLGSQLPNTTALNAITRALGLGPDFRTYKATIEAQEVAAADPDRITSSNLLIAFPADFDEEEIIEERLKHEFLGIIVEAGFQGEITDGAHGFSVIRAWSEGHAHYMTHLEWLQTYLLDRISGAQEDEELPDVAGSMIWQEKQGDRDLTANFMYMETGQVASASLNESAWRARTALIDLDNTERFLLLYSDNEIPGGYDESDISLQDIMTNIEIFED